MKIILISPQPDVQAFGIRSLSACLKKEKHDVKILFLSQSFTNCYSAKILNNLVDFVMDADLIGISVMTNFFENAIQITQKLKQNLKIPIIWGGVHPTIEPAECLNYADIICIGEAENTLIEIAKKIEKKQKYYYISGSWVKINGQIIKNKLQPPTKDLDKLPFLDYDYETHYILCNAKIHKINANLMQKKSDRIYITLATRGCPFGCTYCFNNTFNKMYPAKNIVRKRSVNHIIRELINVKEKGIFNYIKFDDDAFFTNTLEDIKDFCKAYKKFVGLPLMISGATPTTLTNEKLSLLIDAGLIHLRMGIQTGSETTKKMYKRYYSNQQILDAAKIINQFKDKIWPPKYDIILDNPWETNKDLIKTLRFLSKLPIPFHLSIYSLAFYPGTELYEKAKKEVRITNDGREIYQKDYENCKKTYLNKLFFLLRDYAIIKKKIISPTIMTLLTNQKLRELRFSWLLYSVLKIWLVPLKLYLYFIKIKV